MGKKMATACYRELGAELRKIREAAGRTEAELSHDLGWSATKVSRSELGYVRLSVVDVIHYLAYCGVYGNYGRKLHVMCREAEPKPGYFLRKHEAGLPDSVRSLIYHETTATASTSYEPELVPGLLQTEAYIRAVTADRCPEDDIDLTVSVRMDRQQILHRPGPAQFTFFVHEHALRLVIGSEETMHEQLLTLTLLDGLPHVNIRVVPTSKGARTKFGGAFRLLQYADHKPLAYLDGYFSGLFLEDTEYVDSYRMLIPLIAELALDEGQSREFLAALASQYDRERVDPDVHDRLEEKQP